MLLKALLVRLLIRQAIGFYNNQKTYLYFQFGKAELASAEHRLQMCQLATKSSSWIRADGWECQQRQWSFTLSILDHYREELQNKYNSNFRLMLLCGADLVDSFTRIKPDGSF